MDIAISSSSLTLRVVAKLLLNPLSTTHQHYSLIGSIKQLLEKDWLVTIKHILCFYRIKLQCQQPRQLPFEYDLDLVFYPNPTQICTNYLLAETSGVSLTLICSM